MRVKDLIEKLQQLPPDDIVICQVVAEDGPEAWNMFWEVEKINNSKTVQLRVFHPQLKELEMNWEKPAKERYAKAMQGWNGYGWKDGRYIDSIQEYFDWILNRNDEPVL